MYPDHGRWAAFCLYQFAQIPNSSGGTPVTPVHGLSGDFRQFLQRERWQNDGGRMMLRDVCFAPRGAANLSVHARQTEHNLSVAKSFRRSIRKAIEYAESKGFRYVEGGKSQLQGVLLCVGGYRERVAFRFLGLREIRVTTRKIFAEKSTSAATMKGNRNE